jgi:hypothetical protein
MKEQDALSEINKIADQTIHRNTNSPNQQTIWVE